MSTDNLTTNQQKLNRLLSAVSFRGVSKSEIATKTGYSKATVGAVLEDKTPLSSKFSKIFCSSYLINEQWLETGEGDMVQTLPADFPHGPEKFRKYTKNVGENSVSEPDINSSREGYPAPLRPVVESFEIATQGKSTEEINEIVKKLMRDLWAETGS